MLGRPVQIGRDHVAEIAEGHVFLIGATWVVGQVRRTGRARWLGHTVTVCAGSGNVASSACRMSLDGGELPARRFSKAAVRAKDLRVVSREIADDVGVVVSAPVPAHGFSFDLCDSCSRLQ